MKFGGSGRHQSFCQLKLAISPQNATTSVAKDNIIEKFSRAVNQIKPKLELNAIFPPVVLVRGQ